MSDPDFLIAAETTNANPHRLEVTIEQCRYGRGYTEGHVEYRAVCDASVGAKCRVWCEEGCDEWSGVHEREHQLIDQGQCGWIEYLNADATAIPDLYCGEKQPLHSGPILFKWDGGDSCEWRYDVQQVEDLADVRAAALEEVDRG